MPFDEILPAVASGRSTHGLIIHEVRPHGKKGVTSSSIWGLVERQNGSTLLGGNVVLRKHGMDLCADITMDVKNSIVHAIENPDSALSFAKKWGRGFGRDEREVRRDVRQPENH